MCPAKAGFKGPSPYFQAALVIFLRPYRYMSSDNAEIQEIREENDGLQDEEQVEKSEEFENQGFEYGAPLDDNPEHAYSEGHPEAQAAT